MTTRPTQHPAWCRHGAVALACAALLAASPHVSAQSSVTVFGILDTAISWHGTKSSQQFARHMPDMRQSRTVLTTNSLIGFRGTEDLGGGLAAGFWLESQVSNDDGTEGMGQFARRSTVSLSGPFGEFRLGRDYTPIFWMDTLYDPFINIGSGANLVGAVSAYLAAGAALSGGGLLNGGLPGGPDNYVRTSNSISYFLPPGLGGLYGQFQYALHDNPSKSGAPYGTATRGRQAGVRLGYASGPLDVSMAYSVSTAADGVLPDGTHRTRRIRSAAIAGSYDLGPAKLHAELSQVRDEQRADGIGTGAALPPDSTDRYNGAMLGLSIPIGPGLVRTTYSRVRFKGGAQPADLLAPSLRNSATAGKLALGYVHFLSKRTSLYATAARIRIVGGQHNPGVMGVPTGAGLSYASTGGYGPRSATGYDIGIRHLF